MHKSRLGTVVIDCQTADLDAAAEFWSKVLGWPSKVLNDPENANYRGLEGPNTEVKFWCKPSAIPVVCTWTSEPTTSRPRSLGSSGLAHVALRRSSAGG